MERYIVDVVNGEIINSIPYEEVAQVASQGMSVGAIVGLSILAGILFVALTQTFFIVRQQTVRIVETFGKFARVAKPGLSLKIPFIQQIAGTLSLRIQEMGNQVTVKSSDNAFLAVPVKVQYQVIEYSARAAFYKLENAEQQISSYVVNVVRSTATGMDMETIFQSKDTFEKKVQEELEARFGTFGFKIVNVLVDDPQPTKLVSEAFNRVIASKRELEAAENEAAAIKVKKIAEAEAEAESLTLKSKAYVEQRNIIAKGMNDIANEDPKMLEYLIGIDYRDTIRDAADKGQVVILPAEMQHGGFAQTLAALNADNK